MPQRQHILSEWLLKAFGRPVGGRYVLDRYDKSTNEFDEHDVDGFMVEVGAHSTEIEHEISRVEAPPAQAARTLLKRAKRYPAGIYAVTDQDDDFRAVGPALADMGQYQGTRLLVAGCR